MASPQDIRRRGAFHAIERAGLGYCVEGACSFVWEPSFQEAAQWRDELEASYSHYRGLDPADGPGSRPYAGAVYGPISSRRLGRSLGVNLSPPGRSVCTFRCVYCEYRPDAGKVKARWTAPKRVAQDLSIALPRAGCLDSITISGHGEPTLHPRFADVVDAVLGEARGLRPEVPVRVLTNGTGAIREPVRRGLDALDERIVKIDAAPGQINRPVRTEHLGSLIQALSMLREISVQSCFVEGVVSNTGAAAIREWIELIGELQPRRVQVYTVDRRPGSSVVHPVPVAHLEDIAGRLRDATGLEARAFA